MSLTVGHIIGWALSIFGLAFAVWRLLPFTRKRTGRDLLIGLLGLTVMLGGDYLIFRK